MKKFDIKSLIAGMIIGTLGITTVFAATEIRSASLSDANLMLNGAPLSLNKSLILVTMDDEQTASLYAPAIELLETLGYTVHYDSVTNVVNVVTGNGSFKESASNGNTASESSVVMNLTNHAGQRNIAESGSFQAEDNQILTLTVTSDIKGGAVDLFLFDPNGNEQRITIGSADITKEIPLEKGIWQYNCSGMFKDGGNVTIVGTIK